MNTPDTHHPTRRGAMQAGAGLAVAATAATAAVAAEQPRVAKSLIAPGDVVLFQGDSITDAGRKRDRRAANDQRAMGNGYAWLAAAELLIARPDDDLKIHNRGISGNKVYQLAERWQSDCLDLEPDVLSILIGVNDLWHRINGTYDGTIKTYDKDLRALLDRTRQELPEVKLVLCEPFVLHVGAVGDEFFPAIDDFRAAAAAIAGDFGAAWVPFQTTLNAAAELAAKEFWLNDGVHPTTHGAAVLANAWLRAVGDRI